MTKLHLIKAAEKSKTKNTGELGDKNRRGSNCILHVGTKLDENLRFMFILLISFLICYLLYFLLFSCGFST